MNCKSSVEKEGGGDAAVNHSSKGVNFGDLVWVSIHDSSWWPAQVIDDSTVSKSRKPSKQSGVEVLVRLYGSYKYLYVDLAECCMKFENALKENSGNYHQILMKTLEKDLTRVKSGKTNVQKSNSKVSGEASQVKLSRKGMTNKTKDLNSARFSSKTSKTKTPSRKAENDTSLKELKKEVDNRKRKQELQGDLEQNSLKSASAKCKKQKKDGLQKPADSTSPSAAKDSSTPLVSANTKEKKQHQKHDRVDWNVKPSTSKSIVKSGKTFSEKSVIAKRTNAENNHNVQGNTKPRKPTKIHSLKTPKGDEMHEKSQIKESKSANSSIRKSPEISARRIKVMQTLGLIAPIGSPFQFNFTQISEPRYE